MYARAAAFVPLLSVPDWESIFLNKELPLDNLGLLRSLETIAFPGTKFKVHHRFETGICRVSTKEYTVSPLYTHEAFLEKAEEGTEDRIKKLPSKEEVLRRMISRVGDIYIWGGNCSHGIPMMLSLYPPKGEVSETERKTRTFQGVDCSGLLYEAADGSIPRNTGDLVHHGINIPLRGKTIAEIQNLLQPLDLFVWKGHMFIVIDKDHTIESKHSKGGVIIRDFKERFEEILEEKKIPPEHFDPNEIEEYFFLRRWI